MTSPKLSPLNPPPPPLQPLLKNCPYHHPHPKNPGDPAPSLHAIINRAILWSCHATVLRPQHQPGPTHCCAHRGVMQNAGHHIPEQMAGAHVLLEHGVSVAPCTNLPRTCGRRTRVFILYSVGCVPLHSMSTWPVSSHRHSWHSEDGPGGTILHPWLCLSDRGIQHLPGCGSHSCSYGESEVEISDLLQCP